MNDAMSARRHDEELLDEGSIWLLDLVSAVDHLRRGYRPGLTVWDALAEARVTSGEADGQPTGDATENGLVSTWDEQRAVRRWVVLMAERYNGGFNWPHPVGRRPFPPPRLGT